MTLSLTWGGIVEVRLESVEERGGDGGAHLVAFGEDTEGELAVREDIKVVDMRRGGNAGEGELNAHSDGPELADVVGAVSEGGEGFRRPGRAVSREEVPRLRRGRGWDWRSRRYSRRWR